MRYLLLIFLLFSSCVLEKSVIRSEGRVFITIDGHLVELVSDEYGNQYIKQKVLFDVLYIPFTFPTEDDEIPRVYETKIQ